MSNITKQVRYCVPMRSRDVSSAVIEKAEFLGLLPDEWDGKVKSFWLELNPDRKEDQSLPKWRLVLIVEE